MNRFEMLWHITHGHALFQVWNNLCMYKCPSLILKNRKRSSEIFLSRKLKKKIKVKCFFWCKMYWRWVNTNLHSQRRSARILSSPTAIYTRLTRNSNPEKSHDLFVTLQVTGASVSRSWEPLVEIHLNIV